MALVNYISSDEDGPNESTESSISTSNTHGTQRKRKVTSDLPPLPSKFLDLYASNVRTSTIDDPSLHGGKRRAHPHVVGNWPTHIYLEWYPSMTERDLLNQIIFDVKTKDDLYHINSFLTSELNAPLPLHISLSRPIQINTEQKDSFLTSLRQSIESSGIRPFHISFTRLAWVANYEKSRWFLVLRASSHRGDELQKLLHLSNTVVQRHGQLPLYENTKFQIDPPSHIRKAALAKHNSIYKDKYQNFKDSTELGFIQDAFHVSIAWSLAVPNLALTECLESITSDHVGNITRLNMEVENVKLKVGNTVSSFTLLKSVVESKHSIGI